MGLDLGNVDGMQLVTPANDRGVSTGRIAAGCALTAIGCT
jgi:hypothetical protein